jgi:chromosome segregation ATPase
MADSNRNSGVLTFKSAASILLQKVKVERASQVLTRLCFCAFCVLCVHCAVLLKDPGILKWICGEQFQAWNAPSAQQLPTELRNQTDILQQEALCEQSKLLCMKVFESLHTDVLAVRRQMGVLPPGVPKSTVGLMLHGCLVDNVLTGGPACSMGFEKGDVIVQIDGHEVNTSNIHDYLLGDDIPGHFVEITIRKQGTGQIITVHLERASSAGIADRRRLFELFNALKVAAEKSHAAEKNTNPRGGGTESQIVDDIIALWTKMVQEDDSCTKQVKENVTNMQHDCYDELAKLKTVLEQLYWKIHENVMDAHDKGGASVPALESEIARLKTLLAGANLDNENLRGRAKELETQNKNKDNLLKGLERERDDALMHVEHLCGQLEELQRSMKALQDARAATESERDKARAEMSKSSGALQELRTGNEDMAKRLEKAEESRDALLAELARLKGYQQELEVRLATNDASLQKIVKEYQASNDEFEAEKGKYIFAQEQVLMLSDNAKNLEQSKSLAVAAEHRVSGTLEELRSEHGKCLEELIKLQKEKDKAVAASEQCLGRLDEIQKQIGLKDEKIKKEEKEKIAAQKELERIRGQLLELESIKGQVASLGDLVEQLNKENAQLVSEVQTVRGQLSELRDKLAKEAAALQQALGDKEQALKDANVSRGAEKELREQLETLDDSMNSVQEERAKCKADLEKALGQLLEMEKIKAQLLDLRALHGEAAATLKNTEAKNMELQKELKALEGRHEELLGSYKDQSSALKRMEVEKNAALSSEEKMRGQKDALAATCNECKESLQEQIADKERLMVLQGQLRGKMFELNENLKKLLQDNKELLVDKEKAVAAAEEVKRKVSQLESSNDVLEQSLTSLKNECDEAKKKIIPLQKESERLKAHNTSLQQQIDAMKELQRRLEDAQSECANKDGAYDALQAQYVDKKGALQDVTQQLEILRKERDSSNGKLGELKKHLDGVKESLELAIKERHDAKVEVDTLKGQLEGINLPQLEGLIENLKGQLAACKAEMESLVKALKQADAEKESRNKEIEKLKGSLVDQGVLKMQFLELRDELERKDVALKQLREEKHLLNKDFESMKSLHEIRKDELAGTQQDLRLATQALQSAQAAEAKIAVVLDDKERTYAAKSQDAKLLESDCMRISADYATVKAQLDGLKPQLSESQDICSKTSAHLADALREKESLAQKADELKGQIEELRRQLAEREREANQLMSAKATALQNENALRGQLFESKANCQQTADLLIAANSEKARVAGLVQVVEGRMKEMQNIIADMQSQLKISNDERDTACRNLTIMKGQLAEKDAQLSELHQKQQKLFDSQAICRKLDTELEICRAQLRTCTDQLQKAEEARKDAEEQTTRVSREFASCHPTINELDSSNAELEQKLKEKEAKCKELELKYLESERRLNKCDETINIMRQQVEVANNTSSQKELEAKLAGSERENFLKEIDDLKRARDDLKKKFEEELAKCKVEIAQVKADRDRVRNEHMLCDKEIQKLRTETGELKIELAALIKECNQMRAERNNIAALQKNLEALLTENGFYKIQQETWRADELSLREQIANLEKRMKEVDEQAPQISQRAVAPQRAAPATQFSQRPLPVQPKAAMVGLGMIVKESGGRLVITEVSPGGGAWESGKVWKERKK